MNFAEEDIVCPVCGETFSPEYGKLNEYGDIVCPSCAGDPPLYEEEESENRPRN